MDFGSILTNSAKGSCKRRAIETAPRSETSKSGNSCAASSEAEYTEAPASFTITLLALMSGLALSISATSLSVSREWVPLPIEISSTLCCLHMPARVRIALSTWFCGWKGKTVLVPSTLPVLSTTATLMPVRTPGSRPIVVLAPAGAAINRSFRLLAKI